MRRPYTEAFLGGRPSAKAAHPDTFEDQLRQVLERARGQWAAVSVEPDLFLRYLAERLPADQPVEQSLARIHATDLYLACACAHGHAAALAELETHFLAQVPAFVARTDASPAFADEVKQELRHRLLVGEDGPPRIAQYSARGPLGAWLRMAAVREALRLKQDERPDWRTSAEGPEPRAVGPDPEMGYLKGRYARDFEEAFEATLAALPTRERNILRLYFLEDLTTTQIGAVLGVHNSTITRWLAQIRSSVVKETNRRLRERLKVDPSELKSILRLVRSRLDISIRQALRPDPATKS